MFTKLFTICTVLCMIAGPAMSQHVDWDAACAVAKAGCTPWSATTTVRLTLALPHCIADIDYKTRVCGTDIQVVITGWTVNSGCDGFDDEANYHHEKTGLKEYIIEALLHQLYGSSAPSCTPGPPATFVSVYSAACGIWACCEYTLPPVPQYICEPEWGADAPPHYGTTVKKVKSCKWKPCGRICCERKYSLCRSATMGVLTIQIVSKNSIGTCSGQDDPVPFSKPCESGC